MYLAETAGNLRGRCDIPCADGPDGQTTRFVCQYEQRADVHDLKNLCLPGENTSMMVQLSRSPRPAISLVLPFSAASAVSSAQASQRITAARSPCAAPPAPSLRVRLL